MIHKDLVCDLATKFIDSAILHVSTLEDAKSSITDERFTDVTYNEAFSALRDANTAVLNFCSAVDKVASEECLRLKATELRDLCRENNVEGYWRMNKAEMQQNCCLV